MQGLGASEPFVASYDRFFAGNPQPSREAGKLLLAELHCTACHAAQEDLHLTPGPTLQGAPRRLHAPWLISFLVSPGQSKPGSTMPDVLHSVPADQKRYVAQAIVAFLSAGEASEPSLQASGLLPVAHEFWRKGDRSRGRTLYHQVGCVACHAIDPSYPLQQALSSDLERKIAGLDLAPDELETMGLSLPREVRPIPVSNLAKKYSLRSLSMFLLDPPLIRPAGRMPSLKLQPHEAADLASYLLASQSHAPSDAELAADRGESAVEIQLPVSDEDMAAKGRYWFEKLACANCHPTNGIKATPFKPLDQLHPRAGEQGCLSGRGDGPRYELGDKQVASLTMAIEALGDADAAALSRGQPELALELLLLQLNCFACHQRGGRGGVGPKQVPYFENKQQVDLGDEGRLPPPLDHVGRKLSRGWLQKVLEGKGDVRPYFRARMPAFASHAQRLADAIAKEDSLGSPRTNPPTHSVSKAEELEAGRALMDAGCVQCHAFRGESMPGTIGIDLAGSGTRLQREWFRAFLLDPASLKKGTRMPSFFPDGKSAMVHIAGGNVDLQIDALWSYLHAKNARLPAKLEHARAGSFELKPSHRPIVLRTFMDSETLGTHAIAVGMPAKVHFVFDSRNLRIDQLWKGRFLDAQGTWFDRFAPPAVPLGHDQRSMAKYGYVRLDAQQRCIPVGEPDRQFLAYRLDEQGVPTFVYEVGAHRIEDRIDSVGAEGLKRRLKIEPTAPRDPLAASTPLWLVLCHEALRFDADGTCVTRTGLKVTTHAAERRLVQDDTGSYGLVRIPGDEPPSRSKDSILQRSTYALEVSYRW
jgi:mono/diheme cytochrome c family protein